jgi:hypothetical protein
MINPTADAISASSSSAETLIAEPTEEVIENKERMMGYERKMMTVRKKILF